MTTWTTIVNPNAGGGRCGRRADAALERLRAGGLSLDVHRTTGPGDATEIARRAREAGSVRFLSVGGDGTTYEVVNGLFPRGADEARPTVGMVPLGTGNSFLRDFGITTAEGALDAILGDGRRPCDVIRCDHAGGALHYVNLLSIGFSARAGALTNRRFKPFGASGYALAVAGSLATLKHPTYPVRLDDADGWDARPCTLLSFSNSRYTGGTMMMAPEADVADGALDVIRIGALSRLGFLRAFPKIYAGTHVELPSIDQGRARRVTFDLDGPVDVMVDGEIRTLGLRALEVLPAALEVPA